MDRESAREIAGWRYDAPYDLYNCAPEQVEEAVQGFLEPMYRYHSLWDADGRLVGYCGFGEDGQVPGGDYSGDALDIGGGLRPERTGQGLGLGFLEAAIEFARRHYAPTAVRVTVAAFNRRALRVCERAGFRPVQTFAQAGTGRPFAVLVREA